MAAEGFTFGLGLKPGMAWEEYLKTLRDELAGRDLPPDRVPAAFLVADVGGEIVGRRRSGTSSTISWRGKAATSATACFPGAGGAATPPRSSGRA